MSNVSNLLSYFLIIHPCTGLLPWVFQFICKRSGQVVTNVEQSLQETFERNLSVVKYCRLNKPGFLPFEQAHFFFYVFFFFFFFVGGGEGEKKGEGV